MLQKPISSEPSLTDFIRQCLILSVPSITKQRKFYAILLSGFRIILFFQYEHLEVLFIVNGISFDSRGP